MKTRTNVKMHITRRMTALLLCVMFVATLLVPFAGAVAIKLPSHKSVAESIADEGTVLLKNDGVLPLAPTDNVVGMGNQTYAYSFSSPPSISTTGFAPSSMVLGGLGSGKVITDGCISYADGLKSAVSESKIASYEAITDTSAATVGDKVIYFINRLASEANDTPETYYYLTDTEKNNILALIGIVGKENVIAVLNVGGVVDTTWLIEQDVGAIVCAYYGGEMAGASLANILTGDVNPSGKTVDTWAKSYSDYPCVSVGTAHQNNVTKYTEDIYTGYRYFETFDPTYSKVNYEFGFGLSYTDFAFTNKSVSVDGEGRVTATVTVTNIGSVSGKEVVQVYCKAPSTSLDNPARELVGFAKTRLLAPGESETVNVMFDLTEAADFDDLGAIEYNAWVLQKGDYEFYIGNSVKNAGEGGVVYTHTLTEDSVVKVENTELDTLLYERLTADGDFEKLNTTSNRVVSGSGTTIIQAETYQRSGWASTKSETFYQGALGGAGVGTLNNSAAYIEYDLYVEKAGTYNIAFALASFNSNTDILSVYVNGVDQDVTVDVTATHLETDKLWYKSSYMVSSTNNVTLPAGEVTLKIASNGSKMVNIDFFTLHSTEVAADKETVIEAEALYATSLATPFAHYPDGMATGRSVAAGTTYTYKVNAQTAGSYYLALSASNVTAASATAAKVTVNGVDVTERIALMRSAYGGADGLSYGSTYPFTTNLMGGGTYITYDGNSDDYMFVKTDDILIDLAAGENTIVITTLDTAITCIDSLTLRPESMGAANVGTYKGNTSDFGAAVSMNGATLDTLITFDDLLADKTLMAEFLSQLSIDDLISISHLEASGEGNINSSTGAVGGNSKTYGKVDSKFNIPLSNTSDGPAGLRMNNAQATWFPCMTMLASTFNVELAKEFGAAVGTEAINGGITMWLAPGLNIHRDPLCGRNFEYFSEDPTLTAMMASAVVESVQQEGVSVCVKHYFANNQETRRHAYDAYISSRAMREIYLRAFEKTVKNASPFALMSSYNRVNGSYVACTEDYLEGVLRDDWGYEGLIVGDWGSGYDHLSSLKAGNNVKSMYPTIEVLKAALCSGILTRAELEENAEYVVNYLMTVEEAKNFVCYIGDKGYTTLQSAVDNVKSGETIVLKSDIELADSVVIPNTNLTFTIDGANGEDRYEILGHKYLFDKAGLANINFNNLILTSTFTGMRFDPGASLSDGSADLSTNTTRTYNFNNCDVTFNDLGFKISGNGASNLSGYVMNFNGSTLTQNTTERLFYVTSLGSLTVNLNDTVVDQNARGSDLSKGLFLMDGNASSVTVNIDGSSSVIADPATYKEDTAGQTYAHQYMFLVRGTANSFALNLESGASLYLGGTVESAKYSYIYKESDGSAVKVTDGGAIWKANAVAAKAGIALPSINNADAISYGWEVNGAIYGASFTNANATDDTEFTPVYISKSDFDMEDGAAVRSNSDGGIRFTTYVSDSLRELLGENAVFGTLVGPNALIDGELTIETATAKNFANIVAHRWATKNGMPVYYAAIIGFPDTTAAYRTNFAARSYLTMTYADGSTNTIYTDFDDQNIRSSYTVAYNLYNREESPITDNEIINNIIYKAENCSPCLGVNFKSGSTTYSKCKFCGKLINAPTSVDISSAKYADAFDLFVSGPDVDVTYTFTNTPGSNSMWHNFILDVQPAVTFSDGSVHGLYNSAQSKFPILPYYNSGYYTSTSDSKHDTGFKTGYGVSHTFLGSLGLLMPDGTDITDSTTYKTYMAEGLNVTVHFERENYGALKMTVDYVTRTTGCYGKIEVSYGFEGYKDLYLGLTGEKCMISDLEVVMTKGSECKANSGTSVLENGITTGSSMVNGAMVIDNNQITAGTDNYGTQRTEYRFKGDYEIELQFTMSSSLAESEVNTNGYDTWNMRFYANSGSTWDSDFQPNGNGMEAGGLNHGHTSSTAAKKRSMNLANGYTFANALYGATVTLKISRMNGYTTVSGIAERDGKITAYYSFYSKDLTYTDSGTNGGTLWTGGYQNHPTTIRMFSEDSVMTITKLDLISGENYK